MREFGRLAVSGVIGMTQDQRREHIAYYRTQMQEMRDMNRWLGPDAASAQALISTRLATLDRMVAILQDPG